jgi:hypothetical protein
MAVVSSGQRVVGSEIDGRIAVRLRDKVEPCRPVPRTIDGSLFHYTTGAGLIGIVSTATLWATACEYLNDPKEWWYGASLAEDALRRLSHDFGGPISGAIEILIASLESVGPGGRMYVTCFCDEGDLLSQWRGYADRGGGYCLELDGQAVQRWADRHEASLIKVEYDPAAQADLLEEHLRSALQVLQEDLAGNSDPENIWQEAANNQLRTVVMPLVTQFKHESFRAEGERRLAYFLGSGGITDDHVQVGHRLGRGFVVPYLPFPFADESAEHRNLGLAANEAALPISSVRCGPTTHPSLGRSGVTSLLERYRYRSVPVEASAVPYRD